MKRVLLFLVLLGAFSWSAAFFHIQGWEADGEAEFLGRTWSVSLNMARSDEPHLDRTGPSSIRAPGRSAPEARTKEGRFRCSFRYWQDGRGKSRQFSVSLSTGNGLGLRVVQPHHAAIQEGKELQESPAPSPTLHRSGPREP